MGKYYGMMEKFIMHRGHILLFVLGEGFCYGALLAKK